MHSASPSQLHAITFPPCMRVTDQTCAWHHYSRSSLSRPASSLCSFLRIVVRRSGKCSLRGLCLNKTVYDRACWLVEGLKSFSLTNSLLLRTSISIDDSRFPSAAAFDGTRFCPLLIIWEHTCFDREVSQVSSRRICWRAAPPSRRQPLLSVIVSSTTVACFSALLRARNMLHGAHAYYAFFHGRHSSTSPP